MEEISIAVILSFCLLFLVTVSTSPDTILTTQSIRDGETMVSAGESFRLGFFTPGSSRKTYLGIWYNKISVRTVVWVANRNSPLVDSSGILKITDQGILILTSQNMTVFWRSSNISRASTNPVAQLLESGNLVVKDEGDDNPENFLWQSFDHPSDTFVAGMKIGRNTVTGLNRYISSWKTPDDPSPGSFTFGVNPNGFPEMVVMEDFNETFRLGPWNGLRFSGTPSQKPNPYYTYEFVLTDKEMYYHFQLRNSSLLSMLVINQSGNLQRFTWRERTQSWMLYHNVQTDDCDRYALCGGYGICNIYNNPLCSCLNGFAPKLRKEWDQADWSAGCVRKTPLNCSGDGFRKYSAVKLPETQNSWYNKSMNLDDCKIMCINNCSCTAYGNLDVRNGGSGCLLWFNELIDLRIFDDNSQDIYVRMAASELEHYGYMNIKSKPNVRKRTTIIISSILSTGMLLLILAILYVRKKKQTKLGEESCILENTANCKDKKALELQLFDFDTIASATDNFSATNVLGEGGFGPVFKGRLNDGMEIAVKRLSKSSHQGHDEFMNEAVHIAKLQHRNLVKLIGCCINSEEKMLIYEFMPNKSLNFFIFEKARSMQLDWRTRYHVINGIARGLLYLHQDSRLRIIHRDLKPENILLDYDMNPKISDFGVARSFGGNETQANTMKVVGTLGYLSPEYAIDGLYSVKSDVFSFGVIVLEIVSGRRNRGFHHPEHHLNLLGHAWILFNDGRTLIDESVKNSCNLSEVLRSVHIALLCVQRKPEDRPSMSDVVFMLNGESALPEPKIPAFFMDRDDPVEVKFSSTNQNFFSANNLSITLLVAR